MWRSTALASLGDLPDALRDAEEALRLARSVDDPDALADALTALVATQVWLGQGIDRALVTQALELEASTEPRAVARRASLRVAQLLARTGEIDESRSMCTSLLDEAVGSGDDDAGGILHAELGWIEFLAGDWGAALDHLRKGRRPGPEGREQARSLGAPRGPSRGGGCGEVAREGSDRMRVRGAARSMRRSSRCLRWGRSSCRWATRPPLAITSGPHGSSTAARASESRRCSRSSPITRWR